MFGLNTAGIAPRSVHAQASAGPRACSQFEFTVTGCGFVDDSALQTIHIALNISRQFASVYSSYVVEAPVSVTFNPETPAAWKIAAETPGPAVWMGSAVNTRRF